MTAVPQYQKLAVIFGCNYFGQNQLHGCINDANNIKKFLIDERGFDASNVHTIYNNKMVKKNMWKYLNFIVAQTQAIAQTGHTPAVFLYYSGHGTQIPDTRDVEKNRTADALVPWDFDSGNLLVDEDLFQRFIKKLDPKTQLFIFTDCCFSGSNFNLEYNGLTAKYKDHDIPASVVELAGCSDTQTSAEISGHGVATQAFLSLMKTPNKIATMNAFRKEIGNVSIPSHLQTPQVSVSHPSLVNSQLYFWLLQNENTQQLNRRAIDRLVRKNKPDLLSRIIYQLFPKFN